MLKLQENQLLQVEKLQKYVQTIGMLDVMIQLTSLKPTKWRRKSLHLLKKLKPRREVSKLRHLKDVLPLVRAIRTSSLKNKQQKRLSRKRLKKLKDSRKLKSKGRRLKRQREQHTNQRLTLMKKRVNGKRMLKIFNPSSLAS